MVTSASSKSLTLSVSVPIRPYDSRRRYWTKVVRAGNLLPLPSNVFCILGFNRLLKYSKRTLGLLVTQRQWWPCRWRSACGGWSAGTKSPSFRMVNKLSVIVSAQWAANKKHFHQY